MLVTSVDRLFYPLLGYVVYIALGPWVVGPLVEGHTGAVFAWGVLLDNQLVEEQGHNSMEYVLVWVLASSSSLKSSALKLDDEQSEVLDMRQNHRLSGISCQKCGAHFVSY